MFHNGDLQSGITFAIQHGKPVACFVRDDGEESARWENEWLVHDRLRQVAQHAVLLRIQAQSQEAGFLAAFCPVTTSPSLVVIHNGQVRDQINSGVDFAEFATRLLKSVGVSEGNVVQSSPQSSSGIPTPASSETPTGEQAHHHASPSRRAQVESEEEEEDAAPRPTREAKGKQRAVEKEEPAQLAPGLKKKPQSTHAEGSRRKKKEEKEELNRVLNLIEQDKKRRREEQGRHRKELEAAKNNQPDTSADTPASTRRSMPKGTGKAIPLQVRLFDGRTLRSTFPPSATLSGDVRPWVDAAQAETEGKHPPYSFKHILAPLPNVTIDLSDEAKPLEYLEFYPSATLVLVPVSDYATAYSSGGEYYAGGWGVLGLAHRTLTGVYGLASSVIGGAAGMVGRVAGYGETAPEEPGREEQNQQQSQAPPRPGAGQSSAGNIRVRTLADQRADAGRDPTELYNGNQLNFEPRDDDKK